MQGDELKAIRKGLDWTLARMAEELGMSETYVGQMERNQRPIEKRTALAALYLRDRGRIVMVPRLTLGPQS